MFSNLISSTALVSLLLLLPDVSLVSALATHRDVAHIRHQEISKRLSARVSLDNVDSLLKPKKLRRRKTCKPRTTRVTPSPTTTPEEESSPPSHTSSTRDASTPKPTKTPPNSNGNSNAHALKPVNWPTLTQPGAAPAATRTSPADPFLMTLSQSFNNANNKLYNEVHTGEMTYYGQGLGACGDTYDDNSFTAAVSKLMYDTWPGATAETNRNPICGPYVMGRRVINNAGQFVTAAKGAEFVDVGGDGLLNCNVNSQCHVPLTATVKHGTKSIIVKIVDRCEGCAIGDIDLTPKAFAALADPGLGRTDVEWFFNKY